MFSARFHSMTDLKKIHAKQVQEKSDREQLKFKSSLLLPTEDLLSKSLTSMDFLDDLCRGKS